MNLKRIHKKRRADFVSAAETQLRNPNLSGLQTFDGLEQLQNHTLRLRGLVELLGVGFARLVFLDGSLDRFNHLRIGGVTDTFSVNQKANRVRGGCVLLGELVQIGGGQFKIVRADGKNRALVNVVVVQRTVNRADLLAVLVFL